MGIDDVFQTQTARRDGSGAVRPEMFAVSLDKVTGGRVWLEPELPAGGRVPAGAVFRVRGEAAPGFVLDGLYHAQPGIWGMMHHETMAGAFDLVVDQPKRVGGTFIPAYEVAGTTVIEDVVYARPGRKELKYTVHIPARARGLPILVILHGGAWLSNTKEIMRGLARELVRGGQFVVCNVDYRWLGYGDGDARPNSMVDLIADVFGGLAHIQERAAALGGNPEWMGITGDSAGGHLAAVAAFMVDRLGEPGFGGCRGDFRPSYVPPGASLESLRERLRGAIRACAPSYGAFGPDLLRRVMVGAPESEVRAVCPLLHIPDARSRIVPTCLIRAAEDTIIPASEIESFACALRVAGHPVVEDVEAGAGHAFLDWKPDPVTQATFRRHGVPCAARIRRFFERVRTGDIVG